MLRTGVYTGLLICAGLSAAAAQDRITEETIHFDAGASSATIEGTVTGAGITDYLLGARAGQTMTVDMQPQSGTTYFNVIPPDEADVADFVGSSEGLHYEGVLDLDGDWKVRVYQMGDAKDSGKASVYTLKVAISGSPDPSKAREANDFGPSEFDARGDLDCAAGGAPLERAACPFKVLRFGSEATVYTLRPGAPDAPPRILYWDGASDSFSTDSAATVDSVKSVDLYTLTVEGESYSFPEAVLVGG